MKQSRRDTLSAAASAIVFGTVGALLFVLLTRVSSQIPDNGGLGYDGVYYARMLERGFDAGTASMQLRPVVLIINDLANDYVFHDVITTFRVMNVVYAFALALILADLCRCYGASRAATATLIVNVFLCISTAKMFAFYPVLVDLGAFAFMAASIWAIVLGYRLPIVLTTVLAVLSREFGVACVLFGIARDLRTRRSIPLVAATYAPAVIALVVIISTHPLASTLLQNASLWSDPMYVLFWLYFTATLFGGVSLFLLTSHRPWWTSVRQEPEWLAFGVPLVGLTALGNADIWRYGAFLVPALPAFWTWAVSDVRRGRERLLYTGVTLVTIATQRPWQQMDMLRYFREWFPYYVVLEDGPDAGVYLWPSWTYILPVAIVSLVALVVVRRATMSSQKTVTVPAARV